VYIYYVLTKPKIFLRSDTWVWHGKVLYVGLGERGVWFSKLEDLLDIFGPSGVRALPLAAGINVGGHYKWHFFSLSFFPPLPAHC
jgi:hypothetical protein